MKLKNRIVATGAAVVMAGGAALAVAPAASAADGGQVDHLGEANYAFAPSLEYGVGQAGVGWLRLPTGSIVPMSNDQTFGAPAEITLDDNVTWVRAGDEIRYTITATNKSTFARAINVVTPIPYGVIATAAESPTTTPVIAPEGSGYASVVHSRFAEVKPGETETVVITAEIGDVPEGAKLAVTAYVSQSLYGPSSRIVDTNSVIG